MESSHSTEHTNLSVTVSLNVHGVLLPLFKRNEEKGSADNVLDPPRLGDRSHGLTCRLLLKVPAGENFSIPLFLPRDPAPLRLKTFSTSRAVTEAEAAVNASSVKSGISPYFFSMDPCSTSNSARTSWYNWYKGLII